MAKPVLTEGTAKRLQELIRSDADGYTEGAGSLPAVSIGDNRLTLCYATSRVTHLGLGVTSNGYDFWLGNTIVLDGNQNGTASSETVYLINHGNRLESGRYYIGIEIGAIPDTPPTGLTGGKSVFMIAQPTKDPAPYFYLSENLYNPVGFAAPSFQGTGPMALFDGGQGFVIYSSANPHPTYPANVGGYDLLKPFVSIRNADTNWPGVVSTGTQKFVGDKTFQNTVNVAQTNLVGTPTSYLTVGQYVCQYVQVAGGTLALPINYIEDYGWGLGLTAPIRSSISYFSIGSGNASGMSYSMSLGIAGTFSMVSTSAPSSAQYLTWGTTHIGAKGGTTADPTTATAGDKLACFYVGSSDGGYSDGTTTGGLQFKGGIYTGGTSPAPPPSPPPGAWTGTLP